MDRAITARKRGPTNHPSHPGPDAPLLRREQGVRFHRTLTVMLHNGGRLLARGAHDYPHTFWHVLHSLSDRHRTKYYMTPLTTITPISRRYLIARPMAPPAPPAISRGASSSAPTPHAVDSAVNVLSRFRFLLRPSHGTPRSTRRLPRCLFLYTNPLCR